MKNSKKVLITGGGGYIGSVSTYLFLQRGYQVVVADNFSTGYREPLELLEKKFPGQLLVHEVNLSDGASAKSKLKKIFNREKNINAVVHYAASCLVNESMENPEKYFRNNVFGSLNLLSATAESNTRNIIFSSTCAVYGEAEYVPIDEEHKTFPSNPYGESKLMVEKMIRWFGERKGLNYVILRYFNVCGASDDGEIGDSKKPSSLLVQNAVRGALGIEKFYLTCPSVDTPDKTPIRDYINVVDLNTAHLLAVDYLLKGGKSDIFNLGTGHGNSVLEIVGSVQKLTGVKFELDKTEPRQGEYAKMIADTKKVKKVLGWKPERSIEKSVDSLITWYRKHPNGWNY